MTNASNRWWRAMLRDVQFWIPLAVLATGLVLLRWVA
jgi:hypothetical protein